MTKKSGQKKEKIKKEKSWSINRFIIWDILRLQLLDINDSSQDPSSL